MKRNCWKQFAVIILVVVLCVTAVGCRGRKSEQTVIDDDVIVLKAFTLGKEPSGGMDKFYEKLDALTRKDLGCIVRFDYIPWGDEGEEINEKIMSGEYDLYSVGNFSDFKGTAAKNAFLDLNPYLTKVPELVKRYEQVSEDALENYEINGKLFGIPVLSKKVKSGMGGEGFIYREDMRKKWGLPKVDSLETMEQYMYRAKSEPEFASNAKIIDSRIWTSLWYILAGDKYMEITSMAEDPWLVVTYEDPYTVVNRFETPEFKQVLEYTRKWYQDGLIDYDILSMESNTTTKEAALLTAGRKLYSTNLPSWATEGSVIAPSYKSNPEWEWGFYDYLYNRIPVYLPSISNETGIAINVHCQYPEIALKFIEKAHVDEEYYNLLSYGVEGENYEIDEDGYYSTVNISTGNEYNGWTGLGDGYMEIPSKSVDPDWQKLFDEAQKDSVIPEEYSPLEGFSFDKTKVSKEINAMETVQIKYLTPLTCGVTKDVETNYNKTMIKMKEAGLDEYLKEVQRQLTNFKQQKSK